MQLILLSAGKGSRLPKNFRKTPKSMVKVKSKPLLLHNLKFFGKFKKKIIITGYKRNYLNKIIKEIGFKEIINKKYSSTNMVYSLFLAKKIINEDVVIVYGDVIFHEKIFKLLRPKKNILPVNINWFNNWRNRMPFNKILKDAENLVVKENNLMEIGGKIHKDKIPVYQFMGIVKFKKETFLKCFNFFKKIKNNKIDMTTFINLCVKNKILSLNIKKYNDYWYEIDTISDYKFVNSDINK